MLGRRWVSWFNLCCEAAPSGSAGMFCFDLWMADKILKKTGSLFLFHVERKAPSSTIVWSSVEDSDSFHANPDSDFLLNSDLHTFLPKKIQLKKNKISFFFLKYSKLLLRPQWRQYKIRKSLLLSREKSRYFPISRFGSTSWIRIHWSNWI